MENFGSEPESSSQADLWRSTRKFFFESIQANRVTNRVTESQIESFAYGVSSGGTNFGREGRGEGYEF